MYHYDDVHLDPLVGPRIRWASPASLPAARSVRRRASGVAQPVGAPTVLTAGSLPPSVSTPRLKAPPTAPSPPGWVTPALPGPTPRTHPAVPAQPLAEATFLLAAFPPPPGTGAPDTAAPPATEGRSASPAKGKSAGPAEDTSASPAEYPSASPAEGAPEPAGIGGGQAQADFERFFETHHRDLSRYAYLLSGDREIAEDITAEALTATWTHWDRVQAADSPIAYVRRTVTNLAAGRVRRIVRDRNLLTRLGRQLPAVQTVADRDVPAALDLQAALMRLPLRKRQCVVLRHCLDLSEADTAAQLGISVGTVKSQTSKGVAELERLLSNSGDQQSRHQRATRQRGSQPRPRRAKAEPNVAPFARLRGGEA